MFLQLPFHFSYSFHPKRIINLPAEYIGRGDHISRPVVYENLLLIITNTALKIHLTLIIEPSCLQRTMTQISGSGGKIYMKGRFKTRNGKTSTMVSLRSAPVNLR